MQTIAHVQILPVQFAILLVVFQEKKTDVPPKSAGLPAM